MFQYFLDGICNLIYPNSCLLCRQYILNDRKDSIICTNCFAQIKFNVPPFCPKCSRHIASDLKGIRCKECMYRYPAFDFAWAACCYNNTIRELIHLFKYKQKTALRKLFSNLIISFIKEYNLDIAQFNVIVPIPLFSTKLRERGYNQSLLIAKILSDQFKIPVLDNNLVRVKNTKSQSLLDRKERWTNIKGAFKIKNPLIFSDKRILLIDDLLTTGATTSEAANVLKDNGAEIVGVLTLAVT